MNLIEQFRGHVVRKCLAGQSMSKGWPVRRDMLRQQLSGTPDRITVLNLGLSLSQLFTAISAPRGAGSTSESQSNVSTAGAAWAGLVTYYLNACYAGTRAVAIHSRAFVPASLKDSVTVIHNGTTNVAPDLDVILLVLPNIAAEQSAIVGGKAPASRAFRRITTIVDSHFGETAMNVIQCKTNWKDNAQIPLLWNLLYRIRMAGKPSVVTIGQNSRSIDQLMSFAYSFVTVPTSDRGKIKPTHAAVARVRGLSGGHYWGYPTEPHVCQSLAEFCQAQTSKLGGAPALGECGVAFAEACRANASASIDYAAFDLGLSASNASTSGLLP